MPAVPRGFEKDLKEFDSDLRCVWDDKYMLFRDKEGKIHKRGRFKIVRDTYSGAIPKVVHELTVMNRDGSPGGKFRYPDKRDIEILKSRDPRRTLGVETGNPDLYSIRKFHDADIARECAWLRAKEREEKNNEQNWKDYTRKNVLKDWNNPHSV